MGRLYNTMAIILAITWTILIVVFVNLAMIKEERLINQIAISQAKAMFQLIVDIRSWATGHGVVYVPVSKDTPSNPYLDHPYRDVETTGGINLTLINPAYMTRQLSDISRERHGVRTHITSLTPLRPENASTNWESEALRSFIVGEPFYAGLVYNTYSGYRFRYMEPLFLEEACKSCHIVASGAAARIRGGISVTIPVDDLVKGRKHILKLGRITFVSLWLIGLFIIAGLMLALEKLYPKTR